MVITQTIKTVMPESDQNAVADERSKRAYRAIRSTINPFPQSVPHERFRIQSDLRVILSALSKAKQLRSESVQLQALELLYLIQDTLNKSFGFTCYSRRFPGILLNEQEDSSALVEWNFDELRVGFSLEEEQKDSSFYVIGEDLRNGSFHSTSHRLPNDMNDRNNVVQAIIDLVMRVT